jgi:hypothetical protein
MLNYDIRSAINTTGIIVYGIYSTTTPSDAVAKIVMEWSVD